MEIMKKGWREGITRGSGFDEYTFICEYFHLLYCDSIKTEGVQVTNGKFGVTLMNFNNEILLLTWIKKQEAYFFYKTYLP